MADFTDDTQVSITASLASPAPPTPPTPDTVRPVVSNFSPVAGSTIGRTDTVTFDVTDNSGLFARIMVVAALQDGTQELAYDGSAFTARYLVGSTASAITDGLRFVLKRTGGWTGESVTVRAFAVDAAGNTES